MDEIAILRRTVAQPLRAQAEFRIARLDIVADLLERLGLVAARVQVLDRIFPGPVPIGEFLGDAELVVKNRVGSDRHRTVRHPQQMVAPGPLAHIGDDEGPGVVVPQGRTFARELIVLGEFPPRIVVVGDLGGRAAAVEFAFDVDQSPVVVLDQAPALLPEGRNGACPAFVPALGGIGAIVRIAVVHAFVPPAEGQHGVAADALPDLEDVARQVFVVPQVLAVLVFEDDTLPAGHLPDPLRRVAAVPPGVGPGTVDTCGFGPGTAVRGQDRAVVAPRVAAAGVGVAVETGFQSLEVLPPAGTADFPFRVSP